MGGLRFLKLLDLLRLLGLVERLLRKALGLSLSLVRSPSLVRSLSVLRSLSMFLSLSFSRSDQAGGEVLLDLGGGSWYCLGGVRRGGEEFLNGGVRDLLKEGLDLTGLLLASLSPAFPSILPVSALGEERLASPWLRAEAGGGLGLSA